MKTFFVRHKSALDFFQQNMYSIFTQRRIEQLAARRAHNPEVVGSSPTPAKIKKHDSPIIETADHLLLLYNNANQSRLSPRSFLE